MPSVVYTSFGGFAFGDCSNQESFQKHGLVIQKPCSCVAMDEQVYRGFYVAEVGWSKECMQ